jgi:hypothetical protein
VLFDQSRDGDHRSAREALVIGAPEGVHVQLDGGLVGGSGYLTRRRYR